jgi:hypothetical protein
MSLPANWTAGQQFTAANENSVETAVNLSTNTLAAATSTPTASVLAEWDANSNLSANGHLTVPGASITSAAGSTVLTVASSRVQTVTGSTTQTITLPTTSVKVGDTFKVVNQSTGAVTVQTSAFNTVATLPAGSATAPTIADFTALIATPTTAAEWAGKLGSGSATPTANTIAEWDSNVNLSSNNFLDVPGASITAAATTSVLTISSAKTQTVTGSTTQVIALPSTSVTVGATYKVVNQSTGAVSVTDSANHAVATIPAGSSTVPTQGYFTAVLATPVTAAGWDAQVYTGGTAMTFPAATDTVAGLATSQTLTNTTLSTNSGVPWQLLTGGTTLGGTTVTAGTGLTTAIASYLLPASVPTVGETIGINAFASYNATNGGSVTWQIYTGTSSGTGGTLVASATGTSAAGPTAGAACQGQYVIRATGQGNCFAAITAASTAAAAATISTQTATVAVTTTVNNYVTLACTPSAGSGTAVIVQSVFMSPGGA